VNNWNSIYSKNNSILLSSTLVSEISVWKDFTHRTFFKVKPTLIIVWLDYNQLVIRCEFCDLTKFKLISIYTFFFFLYLMN